MFVFVCCGENLQRLLLLTSMLGQCVLGLKLTAIDDSNINPLSLSQVVLVHPFFLRMGGGGGEGDCINPLHNLAN